MRTLHDQKDNCVNTVYNFIEEFFFLQNEHFES